LALDLLFEIFDQTFQKFQISAPWFSDVISGLPVGLFVATLDQAKCHQPEHIQPSQKIIS
jgi:hypothetical protein